MRLRKIILAFSILAILSCSKQKGDNNVKYSATLKKCDDHAVENTSESILSRYINSVAIDKEGNLWVGSRSGFSQLKKSKWHNHYYYLLSPKVVTDRDGDIWILMKNGIKKYVNDSIVDVKKDQTKSLYTSMTKDKKGKLWFSTKKNGVFTFFNKKWECYTTKDNLPSNTVYTIAYDPVNEVVWVGTKKGLAYYKNGKWQGVALIYDPKNQKTELLKLDKSNGANIISTTPINPRNEISQNAKIKNNGGYPPIKEIKVDSKGITWVLTKSFDIWYYEKKKWIQYLIGSEDIWINDFVIDRENNTVYLGNSRGIHKIVGSKIERLKVKINVVSLLLHKKGHMWIGTESQGLIKLNFKSLEYTSIVPKNGILSNSIRGIFIDGRDNLFVATDSGLSSFDGEEWKTLELGVKVLSILGDNKSNLWVLTPIGLKILRGNDLRSIPWPFKSPYWSSGVIAIDSAGTVMIGSSGGKGIYIYKDGVWNIFNSDSGLPSNHINAIFVDNKNNRWVGTKKGLIMIKGKKLKTYNVSNGLAGNNITSIDEDSKGNLWIGTVRGLSKFDGQHFTNSFVNQNITTVRKGQFNDMWVGVQNGCLWRVDINDYPNSFSFTPFPKPNEIFHVSTIAIDSKGNIWTGYIFFGLKKLSFDYKKITGSKYTEIKQSTNEKTPQPQKSKTYKPSSAESGWIAMLHDFSRTNTSTNQKIKPPFLLDWKVGVGPVSYSFPIHSTPILNKGRLYLVDHKGNLWCIDATTGQRLWKTNIGSQNMKEPIPMVIMNDEIIVQGDDNNLNFISFKDGKKKDELNVTLTDMITKEDLIYGTGKDEILTIYPRNRKIVNRIPSKGCKFISCNDEYFVVHGRSLAVFSFKHNKKLWEDTNKHSRHIPPIVYKDRIICVAPVIDCYDLKTGTVLWRIKMEVDKISPAALWGRKLYIQCADNDTLVNLICFDALNGDFVWEKGFDKPAGFTAFACYSFPPVVCNGILFATVTPKVYALDAETGEDLWTKEICEHIIAPLVFGSDRMYITAIGEMYSYKTLKPGKYVHKVKKKEIPKAEKKNMIIEIESEIEDVKRRSSPKIQEWINELHKLAFKGYRSYGESIRCHRVMDSLVAHKQVEVITLLIKKESLTSWTVGSTENFVMTTLKNALNAHPEFGKVIYPYLLKFAKQDTNLTLKRKAILLLGRIDDRRAVITLEDLLSDHAAKRDVLKSLCTSPNDLSYRILSRVLNDESMNKCWRQIAIDIVDYKKDERVKWMLDGLLKSEWADSLTKVFAEAGLKKLEQEKLKKEEKPPSYVVSPSQQATTVPIESLSFPELENLLSESFMKRNYNETYRYTIFGVKKYPQVKTLLYYKGVSAYKIGEINIGIETLISLIEKFPDYPSDKNLEDILLKDALKRPKYKNKEKIIKNYFHKK